MQTWLSNEIKKSYDFIGYHFFYCLDESQVSLQYSTSFLKIFLFLAAWLFIAAHVLSLVAVPRLLIVMASLVAEEPSNGL